MEENDALSRTSQGRKERGKRRGGTKLQKWMSCAAARKVIEVGDAKGRRGGAGKNGLLFPRFLSLSLRSLLCTQVGHVGKKEVAMSKKSVRRRITKEDARAAAKHAGGWADKPTARSLVSTLSSPRRTRNGVTKTDSDLCRDQGRSVGRRVPRSPMFDTRRRSLKLEGGRRGKIHQSNRIN